MERIEFRIRFSAWDAYDAFVEATSEAEALAKVEQVWQEVGADGTQDVLFKHRDHGSEFEDAIIEPCYVEAE